MNILFIANHVNVGGISSYLFTLASGLREKGHNVYLASAAGTLTDQFKAAGIIHIPVSLNTKKEVSPKILLSFFKLKKIIKEKNIDLVHTNSRTTQVLGNLLSRYGKIPHIFTCHGFFKPKLSRRLFPCWGEYVIAISREVKEHLIRDLKLDEGKIAVINNGVDIKKFGDFSQRETMRKKLRIGSEPLIGIIARLSDVKGHIYLIRAVYRVIKTFIPVKLLIVGEGKTKDSLVKEVENLGIKDNVIFIPEAQETKDVLSAMDIFVMPSLQEGLGLALMEAMAQGLAVIGSEVGGIKTLINDKVNGLLVSPSSVQELVDAIILLLRGDNLRRKLGASARVFITENFSREGMVNKTEDIYKNALEGKNQ
ncbi:MAG: glycosyltransferase family 4 protein [Candidatus Omnitrophica bacterium]|nr:glycosyltransferase family 4 protein [Candidatus Omnitrophota bacterium]